MRKHRADAGFSLAALIFFATAASILIAAAVPAYQLQAKRELEEELIFRGEEYARAIQKYQRRFGVYPGSVEQLVSTNGLRFLRRPYTDPITGKEFRIISINPDGSVTGSKIFMRNVTTQPLFGNTQPFGQGQGQGQGRGLGQGQSLGQGQGGQFPTGQFQSPGQGQIARPQAGLPGQQNQPGLAATPVQQPVGSSQSGFASQPGFPSQSSGQQGGRLGGPGISQPTPQRGQTGGAAGFVGPSSGTPTVSGGIIGVASDSDKESIKIYNTRQKYDEWEFIAILGQQAQQGQNPQQPQNPQNPQNNVPGGQRSNSQLNPFTGQPAGAPFNPGGQMAPQNPFGFGRPQQSPIQPPIQQQQRR